MVNVCDENQQGDSHLLQFGNGLVWLIDAGGGNNIVRKKLALFLKKNDITTIDTVFISHAHKDHYEGIYDVINDGVKIKTLYFNIPDKEVCDREKPWGCDYEHINRTLAFIKGHGIPVNNMKIGDIFKPEEHTVLRVLAVYDGKNTPVGETDINDTSAIMKLEYGEESVLFAGDLNMKLGEYLVQNPEYLKSHILKVPHHGTEGVAPNTFFDAVSPKVALVPAPKNLWLSERSKRIRDYFASKNIPVFVSGIDGNVTVILYKDRYEVTK
jgi:competence protein ComEC